MTSIRSQSALQQLQIQLANPLPYDRIPTAYHHPDLRGRNWQAIKRRYMRYAVIIFDVITEHKENAHLG